MPVGPWLPAAIGAVGGLFNNALGANAVDRRNKQEREWAQYTYDQQRKDALKDRDFQNQYDSPKAQMQRLKDAGLSPHLIYGGAPGNNAATVRSSDFGKHTPEAFMPDLSSIPQGFQDMYDFKIKEQQAKNMAEQSNLIQAQIAQTLASAGNLQQQTATGSVDQQTKSFDLSQKQQLSNTYVEMQEEQLRKLRQDISAGSLGMEKTQADIEQTRASTKFTLASNVRAEVAQAQSLQEGMARILKMIEERRSIVQGRQLTAQQIEKVKQEIQNLIKSGYILDIDNKQRGRMEQRGITPGTNSIWNTIKDIFGSIWDNIP